MGVCVCMRVFTHMVHLVLEALAEGSASDTNLFLCLREGHMAHAGHHAILLHHGVGNACDLPQIVLSTWAQRAYFSIKLA